VFITSEGPTVPTRALILLPGYPLLNGYPDARVPVDSPNCDYNKGANKSSAVAEMGDHGHNRKTWAEKRGKLGPHLTQCGLGRGLLPYQMAS